MRWSLGNRIQWESRWPLTMALLEAWFLAGREWNRGVFAEFEERSQRAAERTERAVTNFLLTGESP